MEKFNLIYIKKLLYHKLRLICFSGSSTFLENVTDKVNKDIHGFIMADESVCLDSPTVSEVDEESTVRFQACNEVDRQMWIFDRYTSNVIHAESSKCLTHPKAGTSDILNLKVCKSQSNEQMWELIAEEWKN